MAIDYYVYQIIWYYNWPETQFSALTETSVVFMLCSTTDPPPEQDGQLHTLGLLERLRADTKGVEGTYSDLYRRVDALLRELENPNLHDIANMTFRVEQWDRHAQHVAGLSLRPARSRSVMRHSTPPWRTGRMNASRCGKEFISFESIR